MDRDKHIIPLVVNDVGTAKAYNERYEENVNLLSDISTLFGNYKVIVGNVDGLTAILQRLENGELDALGKSDIEGSLSVLPAAAEDDIVKDIMEIHTNLLVCNKQRRGVKNKDRKNQSQR